MKAQAKYTSDANKYRQAYEFKEGDEVLLSTANLSLTGYSEKFKPKYVGPYLIKRVISAVVYELDMPASFK